MKRVVALIAALIVCTSSVFAWNAESFLSDGSAEYQPYSLDPVEDPLDPAQVPMMMSLRDASLLSSGQVVSSIPWSDLVNLISTQDKIGVYANVFHEGTTIDPGPSSDPIVIPDYYEERIYPDSGVSPEVNVSGDILNFFSPPVVVPSRLNGGSVEDIGTPIRYVDRTYWANSVTFDIDISSLGEFDTFSLDGILETFTWLVDTSDYSLLASSSPYSLSVIVNGDVYQTFYVDGNSFDFGGFVFSGTSPVTSLQFSITYQVDAAPYSSNPVSGQYVFGNSSTLTISTLGDLSGLHGFNDQAQNDLNEHNAIESEWTGSMTENFNALDLSGFTFPGGLVAAFALITGIFNDLWNGMGDYKILYVFPLTLGVVLLLIGRISKFSDRSSSANSSSGRSSSGRGGKGGRSA